MIALRILEPTALGGILASVALALVGHLDTPARYNPLSFTISDYALADRGGSLNAAMVVLGGAILALLAAMRAAGLRVPCLPATLLVLGGLGLAVAAWVPTDPPGQPMDLSGTVHRYVSVGAFIFLPLAGLLLVPHLTPRVGRRVRALALGSGVGLLALLYAAGPGHRELIGLAERLLVGVEVGMLLLLAGWSCLVAGRRRSTPRVHARSEARLVGAR